MSETLYTLGFPRSRTCGALKAGKSRNMLPAPEGKGFSRGTANLARLCQQAAQLLVNQVRCTTSRHDEVLWS